jgi:hypothetical protein
MGLIPLVSGTSLLFLALLGGLAARAGGAGVVMGAIRVTFWGALAMALTAGVRLLIALHSPHGLLETGLHLSPSEKAGEVAPFAVGQSISPVRFLQKESRNTGMFRAFRNKGRRDSTAVETCWRREWDSNPRANVVSRT